MSKKFQSHIGAIRITALVSGYEAALKFQSHIGAIRINFGDDIEIPNFRFQSHIGAIRMKQVRQRLKHKVDISIPHWCN